MTGDPGTGRRRSIVHDQDSPAASVAHKRILGTEIDAAAGCVVGFAWFLYVVLNFRQREQRMNLDGPLLCRCDFSQ
jgi:hypothetical protein